MRCPVCGGGGYATLHRDVGIKSSGGKRRRAAENQFTSSSG